MTEHLSPGKTTIGFGGALPVLLVLGVLAVAPLGAAPSGEGGLEGQTGLDRARSLCELGDGELAADPALARSRAAEAADLARRAQDASLEARALLLQGEAHLRLNELPAAVEALERGVMAGDPVAALVHFRRHDAIEDELLAESRSRRIQELEVAYETERKDRRIEALERQRQVERMTRNALACAVLLALALVLVGRYRLKAQAARDVERAHQELERAYREVERLSRTDPLTGLPNRRAVWARLEEERARLQRNQRQCAVAMADLDVFKGVDDRYGHDRGDAVLVRVAEVLRGALRELDLVGRWGGEEFLLVLPETSAEGGRVVAEKLRQSMAARPLLDDHPELTLTVGVAEMTTDISAEEAVRRADQALVAGKAAGKDRVVGWNGE